MNSDDGFTPVHPSLRSFVLYRRVLEAAADLAVIRLGDREDIRALAGLLVEAERILRKLLA